MHLWKRANEMAGICGGLSPAQSLSVRLHMKMMPLVETSAPGNVGLQDFSHTWNNAPA